MPTLTGVSIKFHTHNQGKDFDTVVHAFVKNRLNTTEGSDQNTTFISNLLGSQRYFVGGDLGDHASSPYLAYGIGLGAGVDFGDGSDTAFDLTLMPQAVTVEDIVLPAVDVHILTNGDNRWEFDYTVTFTFDDGGVSDFSFSSKDDGGLPGIILDQDNRDYSGICAENPRVPPPPPARPLANAVLKEVTLIFKTHNDDKNRDTRLDVEILNRLGANATQQIAVGQNLLPGDPFDNPSTKIIHWPSSDGTLVLNEISLADMVLPEVIITIDPPGDDRWIFDYRVTFEFADPNDFDGKSVFYSTTTSGVILDQDSSRHSGVYQGPSFPRVAARPAPELAPEAPVRLTRQKTIPMSLVRAKFDEFINNRNLPDQPPPLRKIRLHNTGVFQGGANPESYADVRSITAGTGTLINYVSSPTSFSQLGALGGLVTAALDDVNSDTLTISVDSVDPTIFTFEIHFETDGDPEVFGDPFTLDFTEFSITVKLTLVKADTPDGQFTVVDVLHWITELDDLDKNKTLDHVTGSIPFFRYTGTLLGQPVDVVSQLPVHDLFIDDLIHVHLVTTDESVPGPGLFRGEVRDTIFSKLTTADKFSGRTPRDDLNSMLTSWLVGGIADDQLDPHVDGDVSADGHNIVIDDIQPDGDNIVITYTGPRNVFTFQQPADWPTAANPNPAWDFSQGTLANIDHIVVLTMENRSFDNMLGYLSLPADQRGAGRTDIDGLTGGESNSFRGTVYPSMPVSDTVFSPFPPHSFEPVHRAINGGKMDGFASEYAAENGAGVAGQIMLHQWAGTVPEYDALARDFAVGHRWFAPHPGPTFVNRFYELTGRPNLDPRGFWEFDNSSPLRPVFTQTIFDFLSAATDPVTGQPAPVSWTYFEQGYCFLRFFANYTFSDDHIVSFDDQDRGFLAMARAGTLPSVSFIDPHFVELPPGSNDDDAPSDITDGQAFVKKVVEAVIGSPAWNSTLLLIVYDEHGGFYDHVPPSQAEKVSPDLPIDTHGVRVPSFVISPWVGAGTVFGSDTAPVRQGDPARRRNDLHFDHTSILRTIARTFLSDAPPYLGARYAAANDLSDVIGTQLRQSMFRPFIRYNFEFGASQMTLGVKDANPAPGAPLWQLATDGSASQDFSFEDAGNGFFYIRSQVSNLYLTLHPSTTTATPATTATTTTAAGTATTATSTTIVTPAATAPAGLPVPIPPTVIQDVKVVPPATSAGSGPAAAAPPPAVARQQWLLVPLSSTIGPDLFMVENRAAPGMVLQPSDPTQAGPVVLRAITLGTPPVLKSWKVTSPVLSD